IRPTRGPALPGPVPRGRPALSGPARRVVLKGVPALPSPETLYALARMGHGDEIVREDVNFPTACICRCGPEEIPADGLGIPQVWTSLRPGHPSGLDIPQAWASLRPGHPSGLEAVLQLLPPDCYVQSPERLLWASTPEPDQRSPELSPNKGSWGHPGQEQWATELTPLCLQAVVVELVPSDRERGLQTPVWTSYQSILSRAGCAVRSPASWGPQPGESADAPLGLGPSTAPLAFQSPLATIERFEFYEWTRKAFAVVTTGSALSLLLTQGGGPLRKPHPQEGVAGPRCPVPGLLKTTRPERDLEP
ncbi:hypothetical protein EI555_006745, partial [Monodon monoceros]